MEFPISTGLKRLMDAFGEKNPTQLSQRMEEAGLYVPQPTISRILNKKHKTLDLLTVYKFAKYFGVSVETVLGLEALETVAGSENEFTRQLLMFFKYMNNDHKDELLAMANIYYSKDNPSDRSADPYKSSLNNHADRKGYSGRNSIAPKTNKVDTSKSHDIDVDIRRKIGLVDEGEDDEGKFKVS